MDKLDKSIYRMEINEVELASKLAHNGMYDEVTSPLYDKTFVTNEEELYDIDKEGNTTYKEEYQSIFDRHYDYYYDMIFECKIEKL